MRQKLGFCVADMEQNLATFNHFTAPADHESTPAKAYFGTPVYTRGGGY